MKGFRLNETSLINLFEYMSDKMDAVFTIQKEISKTSKTYYSIMKIMDMYFWSVGMELELEEKREEQLEKKRIDD